MSDEAESRYTICEDQLLGVSSCRVKQLFKEKVLSCLSTFILVMLASTSITRVWGTCLSSYNLKPFTYMNCELILDSQLISPSKPRFCNVIMAKTTQFSISIALRSKTYKSPP